MITKDISTYLSHNYSDFLKSITELSSSKKGKALVEDERELYDFDKITEAIYGSNLPDSADAIYATERNVFFVEYKSGFTKRIRKDNFKKELMTCPDDDKKYCDAYATLFFKNQRNEDEILRKSIHFKAVESYMTLMSEIVPRSEMSNGKRKLLTYCVVVDDYVENMEDILNNLAQKNSETNIIEDIRKSLKRFQKNATKDYYYDQIKVFSPHEFIDFINKSFSS